MKKMIAFRILIGLVILAAIAGTAFFAYQAGLANGAALNLSANGGLPQFERGFHPGFGRFPYAGGFFFLPLLFLKCLLPLLVIFMVFGLARRMMWGRHMHGHWGPRHWGEHGEGVPPMFAEWHRRAHEQNNEKPGSTPAEPVSE